MGKQLNLQLETSKWQRDVDTEAAMLIEGGVPPYEATELAVAAVSRRRRAAHATKSGQ